MNIKEEAKKMKKDAPVLAATSLGKRNKALSAAAEALIGSKEEIFAANKADMEAAEKNGISSAVMKRLKFDEGKLNDVIDGIKLLITLPDPLGRTLLSRQLDEGLELYRISCPIGVIGVIFEARPDALVQISTLCIKSGNCAVLKGGKETAKTNKILFDTIKKAFLSAGMPEGCLVQAELHNEIDELLSCDEDVDLLIPRGSNSFVRYIMNNTRIPVMGHADGVCHIYVDKNYDDEKAIPVIIDAKTQYTAACNAVETLLVNRDIAESFLPKAALALRNAGVVLRGTREAADIINAGFSAMDTVKEAVHDEAAVTCQVMTDDEFHTEYLELVISIKLVDNVKEAAEHINKYGSHHTDAIITEDDKAAEYFMQMVDSAGVYRNCSTRFADGFRYGFGAEVGISTGKIHARGPVGLEGLVTYKYKLYGNGQTVGDYASGRRTFKFKDI